MISPFLLREEVKVVEDKDCSTSDEFSDIPSSQVSDGFSYATRVTPSEDFLEAHPEMRHSCPSYQPPAVEIRYRTGRNDYADAAAALVSGDLEYPENN